MDGVISPDPASIEPKPFFRTIMDIGNLDTIILFDIDGTLADCSRRLVHVHGMEPDWDKFFEDIENDPIHLWAKELAITMNNAGYQIYCVSGRPDRYYEKTCIWLQKNNIPYEKVFMRKDGDRRSDDVIKREILHEHFDKSKILFVVDDRKTVIDMWRSEGLICLACAENH